MSEGDRFSILEIEAYVSSVPDFPVFTSIYLSKSH